MNIQSVALSHLVSSEQPRPLLTAEVDRLANSIKEIGLIQPITVTPTTVMHGVAEPGWRIVAGHHRVAAVRALGWTEIDAIVTNNEKNLQNELVEIDENLCRADLTTAQRTKYTKRRAQIWEALYPVKNDTVSHLGKNGTSPVSESGSTCPTLLKPKTGRGNVQFAAATAASTGQTKRTTNRALARGKALGDTTLDKITGTSLDSGVEMDALAKLQEEDRNVLIERAVAGEKVSAKDASVASKGNRIPQITKSIKAAFRRVLDESKCMSVAELGSLVKSEIKTASAAEIDALDEIAELFDRWSEALCSIDVVSLAKEIEGSACHMN